jgi:pilus assembly protein FimV
VESRRAFGCVALRRGRCEPGRRVGSGGEANGAEFEAALEQADDLDLDDSDVIPFEPDLTDATTGDVGIDDDAVELNHTAEDTSITATAFITPNYEDTEVVPGLNADAAEEDDDEIDLGMEDTAMIDITGESSLSLDTKETSLGTDETSLATGELNLDTAEISLSEIDDMLDDKADDDEDISIIDFGGEDFVEPTDIVESVDEADDSILMDVDVEDSEEVKTGTFAPGDFEEPTAAVDSISDIDDMDDLMLPDDVDEVSTKLDLARAFIDMGDTEGARGSLEEVMSEGNEEQKTEAKSLLDQI